MICRSMVEWFDVLHHLGHFDDVFNSSPGRFPAHVKFISLKIKNHLIHKVLVRRYIVLRETPRTFCLVSHTVTHAIVLGINVYENVTTRTFARRYCVRFMLRWETAQHTIYTIQSPPHGTGTRFNIYTEVLGHILSNKFKPMIAQYDKDKDGEISLAEYNNGIKGWFKRKDRNGDGVISAHREAASHCDHRDQLSQMAASAVSGLRDEAASWEAISRTSHTRHCILAASRLQLTTKQ